jgi:hypothetical protein
MKRVPNKYGSNEKNSMKLSFPAFVIFFAMLIFASWSTLEAMDDNGWETLDLRFHSGHFYLATSELKAPGDNNLGPYGMHNLFDDSLQTCWAEGAEGPGIGESLYLDIKEGTPFINIANGYQKSPALFKANNRIKTLKAVIFIGINLPGEVTELFTVYHARMFTTTRILTLTDRSGFQRVPLPFDWGSLLKFKEQTTADFFAGKNFKNESSQPDVHYILQLRIMDIYHGGKYDDTCVSEINTAMPEDNITVMNVYLNDAENTILMDTKEDKGIVLDSAPDAVFQLMEISPDKQWVIVIKMPGEVGNSRVETTYLLYNTRLKMRVPPELLSTDVGDLYDFTQKGDATYLNYLNNKSMSVESLDLGTVSKKLAGK